MDGSEVWDGGPRPAVWPVRRQETEFATQVKRRSAGVKFKSSPPPEFVLKQL